MTSQAAQLVLTSIFLLAAIAFVLLGADALAIGVVGAVLGQGAGAGVRAVANGK